MITAIRLTTFKITEIIPNVIPAIPNALEPPFLAWNPNTVAIIAAINPTTINKEGDNLIYKIFDQTQGKKNMVEIIILKMPFHDAFIICSVSFINNIYYNTIDNILFLIRFIPLMGFSFDSQLAVARNSHIRSAKLSTSSLSLGR